MYREIIGVHTLLSPLSIVAFRPKCSLTPSSYASLVYPLFTLNIRRTTVILPSLRIHLVKRIPVYTYLLFSLKADVLCDKKNLRVRVKMESTGCRLGRAWG